MCGLLGIYSLNNESPIDDYHVVAGIRAISHRGPDEQQHWYNQTKTVCLGHVRLSIIDLQGGHQPFHNAQRDIHAIVNGELYGYQDIRHSLLQEGYQFASLSDSEIVPLLYQRDGIQALHKLRGEFAFCLWDGDNRRFVAARDRFGVKPLYYTVHHNNLLVASEVKALAAAGVPIAWDEDAIVNQSFCFTGEGTFYKNIYEVPPGHFLLAGQGSFHIKSYWDMNYPLQGEETDCRDEQHIVEEVRQLLLDSVKCRLRSDVGAAVYLSGGLDSCAILGMAAAQSAKPPDSFSICFTDDPAYNEKAIAQEMAASVGSPFHEIPMSNDDMIDHYEDAVWHAEKPFPNTSSVAKFLLSRHVRDAGHKVVLSGEGADELFAGYLPFRIDLLQRDPDAMAAIKKRNQATAHIMTSASSYEEHLPSLRLLGFEPSWFSMHRDRSLCHQRIFSDDIIRCYKNADTVLNFLNTHHLEHLYGTHELHKSMYLWTKTILPKMILCFFGDRMEMAHSIEGRPPFLDHLLAEKVVRLPADIKIRNGVEKYIMKEAVRPYVTPAVYKREKHPFSSPPTLSKQQSKLFQFMGDMLISDDCKAIPFFDHRKVLAYFDEARTCESSKRLAYDMRLHEIVGQVVIQRRFMNA